MPVNEQLTLIVDEMPRLIVGNKAQRFPNGNTLIADGGHFRVIEIDCHQNIVWQITGLGYAAKAYRL